MIIVEAILPSGAREVFTLPAGTTVAQWRAAAEPAGYQFVSAHDDGTGGGSLSSVSPVLLIAGAFILYRLMRR